VKTGSSASAVAGSGTHKLLLQKFKTEIEKKKIEEVGPIIYRRSPVLQKIFSEAIKERR
jgi:hypothetical protein